MATIKLNRAAAESGQLPAVCLCCGQPSTHHGQHRFFYRSAGIIFAMWFLGWPLRVFLLPQCYEFADLRVPLCNWHRYRLNLHQHLMLGFVLVAFLLIPLMLLATYQEDYAWLMNTVGLLLLSLLVSAAIVINTVWLLTPRMVEHSSMRIELAGVSSKFVQAFGPGIPAALSVGGLQSLPTMAAMAQREPQPFNWNLVGITLGACLASLAELGICIYGSYFISSFSTRSRLAAIDRQHQSNQARIDAEHQARLRQIDAQFAQQRSAIQPNRQGSFPSPPPPRSISSPTPPLNRGALPGTEITSIDQVNANDRVHIKWHSSWYPGTVLQKQGQQVKIHYDNHADSWDEFVTLDRVRRMQSAGTPLNPSSSTTPPPVVQPMPTPAPTPTPPVSPAVDPAAGLRTWTDSTGKFKIDAELIAVENGEVKLQRPDGKIVTMPIDKLSAADQVLVRGRR